MKAIESEKKISTDFKQFIDLQPIELPNTIAELILHKVKKDLEPSVKIIFTKLILTQGVVGTLSLAICDQFGINPFGTQFSLADYFMKFGHHFCMFSCGFLFIGLGIGLGRQLLSFAEYNVLKQSYFLQVIIMTILSLGVFAMVGAELTVLISLFWLIGAIMAGMAVQYIPQIKTLFYNSQLSS